MVKTKIQLIPEEEWGWLKRYLVDHKIKTWKTWYSHYIDYTFNYTHISNELLSEIQWRLTATVTPLHRFDLKNLSDIKQASMPYLPSIHNRNKNWFEDLPYQVLLSDLRKFSDITAYLKEKHVRTIAQLRVWLDKPKDPLPYYYDFYHQTTGLLKKVEGKNITSFTQLTTLIPELTWQNYFAYIDLNKLITASLDLKNFKDFKAELIDKKIIVRGEDELNFNKATQELQICFDHKYCTTCILKPKSLILPATRNPVLADIYTILLKYLLFPYTHQHPLKLLHRPYHILNTLLDMPLEQVLSMPTLFINEAIHKFNSQRNLTLRQFINCALDFQVPNFSPQALRSLLCCLDNIYLAQNRPFGVTVIIF